jgi:7-cyano-7-deazaguanine synthase
MVRTRAVLMSSGGPDSTIMAYMLRETTGLEFSMLSMDHGQGAGSQEVIHARNFAGQLGVAFKSIEIKSLWGELADTRPANTFGLGAATINQFLPLLPVAATWACWAGAESLYLGFQWDDVQRDAWLKDVLEHYQAIIRIAAANETAISDLTIRTPLIGLSKSEVLRLGVKLGVPLDQTWSCEHKGAKQCGQCLQCQNRRKAFADAGIEDTTIYVGL